MGGDNAARCQCRRKLSQPSRDKLIGQTVKAVAAHAGIGNRARQCKPCRERRDGMVESRIEAGDLLQARTSGGNRPHGCEVIGHVQGIERCQRLKRRQERRSDQFRRDMVCSAMHNAMPDRYQPIAAQMRVSEVEQRMKCGIETVR